MAIVFVHPRATEKAYGLSQKNVYVFNIPLDATKRDVAETIKAQYDVEVVNVATTVQNGKSMRFSRGKNRFPGTTTRKNTKKAYVTLAAGNSIQIFAEPEAASEEKK